MKAISLMFKRALSLILAVLVVFSVFAAVLTASVQNAQARTGDTVTGKTTFNSTLYDYYYDSEMVNSNILQGVAQSYTNEAYHMLNNNASAYYEQNGVNYPIYFGNFYKRTADTFFDYSQRPKELYNFKWCVNLANRANANAVVQGVYTDNLVDGIPAQTTADGAFVKVPYFDKNWLTTPVSQEAMVVNFSLNYGDTHMTMPFTEGDSTGAKSLRLFEVIKPGTNYYFAERVLDCNTLSDDLYGGTDSTKIGIHFTFETWEGMPDNMSVNILTPMGNTISVPMNLDAPNRTYWVVIDKNDPATAHIYNQITTKGKAVQMGEVYENLNFPFDVIDNKGVTYYQFTTRQYHYDVNNRYEDENGNPTGVTTGQNNIFFNGTDWAERASGVRDWNFEELSAVEPLWQYDNDMGDGFFPNNATDPDKSAEDASDYKSKRDLKYGYAVKYEIPFTLSSNGMVLDKDGNEVPTTFEFMGDDDLLIYIDDTLVLDMGGAHKMAKGKIDFSTGIATVTTGVINEIDAAEASGDPLSTKARTGLMDEQISSKGILEEFLKNNKTYDPNEVHKMTIYYVERGMFNANAFIRFNLPVNTSVSVEKEADYTALTEEQKAEYVDDEFTYNFRLTSINDQDVTDYTESIWSNMTNVDMDKVDGDTYTFTLKAGESIEFGNIPANIGYVISEADAEGYTLSSITSQDMTNEESEPEKVEGFTVSGVTSNRETLKYTFLNVANEIPTTAPPTTAAPTTAAPTTTAEPTTVAPTTTVVPTTTQAPTTVVPTTTQAPTTTVAPTTTQAPTTAAPTTAEPTEPPTTTAAPTTQAPIITVAPTTTQAPTTTVAPTTTQAPTTTAAPATIEPTEAPTTTAAPTTAEPTEPPTTTAAPTTTVEPSEAEPAPTTAEPTTTVEPTEAPTTTAAPTTAAPTEPPVTTVVIPTTTPVPTEVPTTTAAHTEPPVTTATPTDVPVTTLVDAVTITVAPNTSVPAATDTKPNILPDFVQTGEGALWVFFGMLPLLGAIVGVSFYKRRELNK